MNMNVWEVSDPLRALIRSGRALDADRLADPDVPLASLLERNSAAARGD
jgi:3-phenylpropionate/trans-cinnamate dioxygenase ferredoxin reductase subunit